MEYEVYPRTPRTEGINAGAAWRPRKAGRKGRPEDSRDWDAGVRAGRVGRKENGANTFDYRTGIRTHGNGDYAFTQLATRPRSAACRSRTWTRKRLALASSGRYDGDRHITC